MGMSTHVYGFRPPDERWQAMKAIYDACVLAKVDPPEEITDFFDDMAPDPAGVEVDLDEAVKDYRDDSAEGIELDLTKLPADVTIVRFVNSW